MKLFNKKKILISSEFQAFYLTPRSGLCAKNKQQIFFRDCAKPSSVRFYRISRKPDRVLSCNLKKNSQETFDAQRRNRTGNKDNCRIFFKFPALNFKDFLPAFQPASWPDTVRSSRSGERINFPDVRRVDAEILQGKMCNPFDGLCINREKCVNRNCSLYVTRDAAVNIFLTAVNIFPQQQESIVDPFASAYNGGYIARVKNLLPTLFYTCFARALSDI